MDVVRAREIVRHQHHAVLATVRRDGTPHLCPVLAAMDDADVVVISTRAHTAKVRNLRRDPHAWLCVLPDAFFGPWAQLDSVVEIVELPEAMPGLESYYRAIAGEHEDWDAYRAAMAAEERVLLRLTITGVGPSAAPAGDRSS